MRIDKLRFTIHIEQCSFNVSYENLTLGHSESYIGLRFARRSVRRSGRFIHQIFASREHYRKRWIHFDFPARHGFRFKRHESGHYPLQRLHFEFFVGVCLSGGFVTVDLRRFCIFKWNCQIAEIGLSPGWTLRRFRISFQIIQVRLLRVVFVHRPSSFRHFHGGRRIFAAQRFFEFGRSRRQGCQFVLFPILVGGIFDTVYSTAKTIQHANHESGNSRHLP